MMINVELKKIIVQAQEYAGSDATVLIAGESGTGKELFAQSIHNYSRRSAQPFVAVNCAAMSSQLLESELFGYEEGAFTGAKRGGKRGVFELADMGTVFLDEIAEMSLETQAHLLRVLEQREVMRVGGERIRPVNIRVITATNKDLRRMVLDGTFRKDLYYRLNVLKIRVPSLRERSEDIPMLTIHFLRRFYAGPDIEKLCAIAENPLLRSYDWPGNIRELRNFAERISVLSGTSQNYDELVSDYFKPLLEAVDTGMHRSDQRTIILNALKDNNGNRENTAKALGMSRSTLWRKMKEAGIE